MSNPLKLTEKDLTAFVCAALAQCLDHPRENAWNELRERARRVEAFLAAHSGEQDFLLLSKGQFFALQVGCASGELSVEERIAEIEQQNYSTKRHIERLEEKIRRLLITKDPRDLAITDEEKEEANEDCRS